MKIFFLATLLALSACTGDDVHNGNATGQVLLTKEMSQIGCDDWNTTTIGVGGIRNDYGSMNLSYWILSVPSIEDFETLKESEKTGELVSFSYGHHRTSFCADNWYVTDVTLIAE